MIETLPEPLRAAIADERVQIVYRERLRDCRIRQIAPGIAPRAAPIYGPEAGHDFDYCPWTGTKLPDRLFFAYHEVLKRDHGIDEYDFVSDEPTLPDEMYSDAWWKRYSETELIELNRDDREFRPWEEEAAPDIIVDLDPSFHRTTQNALDLNEYVPPGFRRTRGRLPHACIATAGWAGQPVMIDYLPWTREFGIRMLDPLHPPDYQPLRIRPISFCPWCGQALPKSLRPEWKNRISRKLRIPHCGTYDPEIDAAPPYSTPAYYCFDNWWRDEGL